MATGGAAAARDASLRVEFSRLEALLTAPSKEAVGRLAEDAVACIGPAGGRLPAPRAEALRHELGLAAAEDAHAVAGAVAALVRVAVYHGVEGREGVAGLLPEGFHPKLGALLAGVLAAGLPRWREQALSAAPSLPRLLDVSWRVGAPTASSEGLGAAKVGALVNLTVEDAGDDWRLPPARRDVALELDKAALGALVGTLGSIKEQLSGIAGTEPPS